MSDIPLDRYVDQRFADLEGKLDLIVQNQEKAVTIARASIENRLGAMNELREQINRERGEYMTRTEAKAVDTRLRAIETVLANYAGRFWAVGVASGILSGVISVMVKLLWR